MYKVKNEADSVDIYIYDEIGEYTDFWTGEKHGVSAERMIKDLEDAGGKPVNIHIDSPGGDVFTGFTICSAIQRYEGKTTAMVEGMAASAASYIAVVCDEVKMNDYAYLMIHCASIRCAGNASYLESMVERLRNIDSNLAEIYRKRSNLTLGQVLDYMDAETWFTANDAYSCGLCTEVIETEERMAACISDDYAKLYNHVPRAVSIQEKKQEKEPEQIENDVISHSDSTMPEVEDAFVVFGGMLYRKEAKNEQ